MIRGDTAWLYQGFSEEKTKHDVILDMKDEQSGKVLLLKLFLKIKTFYILNLQFRGI